MTGNLRRRLPLLATLICLSGFALVSVAAIADLHPGGADPDCALCQFLHSPFLPAIEGCALPAPDIAGSVIPGLDFGDRTDERTHRTEARAPPA